MKIRPIWVSWLLLLGSLWIAAAGVAHVVSFFPFDSLPVLLPPAVFLGWWAGTKPAASRGARRAPVYGLIPSHISWLLLLGLAGLAPALLLIGGLGRPLQAWLRAALADGLAALAMTAGAEGAASAARQQAAEALGYAAGELALAWQNLSQRLYAWLGWLSQGRAAYDPLAAGVFWIFAFWLLGLWAGWALARSGQALAALAPAGLLLAAALNLSRANSLYLLAFLAGCIALMAWHSLQANIRDWLALGVDYAEDIQFDAALAAFFLSLALAFAGLSAEALPKIRTWLADQVARPGPGLADAGSGGEAFGIVVQPPAANVPDLAFLAGVDNGGLPRRHLLGAGPELLERPLFSVRLLQAPEGLAGLLYWRALSYDRYLGNGWETSSLEAGRFGPDEALPGASDWAAGLQVVQEVSWVSYGPGSEAQSSPLLSSPWLVAVGEPLQADVSLQAGWRSYAGSAGAGREFFAARSQASRYLVTSAWVQPPAATPLVAEAAYPAWLAEHYLVLPPELPQRVRQLALALTAEAETPYAKAQALQAYLRTLPYTLELPPPPPDVDVVDYYLFDLRRGYCDYSASAMVVLARAAGIPARLAVGYASGAYDAANRRFVVRAKDAHSWPELYFTDLGWLAFEPTGGLAPAAGPGYAALPPEEAAVLLQERASLFARWRAELFLWVEGGRAYIIPLAAALVGLLVLWQGRRMALAAQRRSSFERIERAYLACRRRALRWLGRRSQAQATPFELAQALRQQLKAVESARTAAHWQTLADDFAALSAVYAEAAYSRHSLSAAQVELAQRLAIRVQNRLRLAWFAGTLKLMRCKPPQPQATTGGRL